MNEVISFGDAVLREYVKQQVLRVFSSPPDDDFARGWAGAFIVCQKIFDTKSTELTIQAEKIVYSSSRPTSASTTR